MSQAPPTSNPSSKPDTGRRELLRALAALTGGCLLGGLPLGAGGTPARREITLGGQRVRTVDVHGHCQIGTVLEMAASHPDAPDEARLWARLRESPLWAELDLANTAARLAAMDAMGIDVQAISNAFWYWADRDLAAPLCAQVNEAIAATCAAHPDRFVGLGTLALQFPDLAVRQMERGVRELGLRGFMIAGSVNGLELSDPAFHPVWARAETLNALIFLHPNGFDAGASRLQGHGNLDNVIGNPLETTVALSHLIFEGTLDRFPGLKLCAAHGGGYLPAYVERSDHCARQLPERCPTGGPLPSDYLRRLWFDTLVYSPQALHKLIDQVGADRLLLGTDYPAAMGDRRAVDLILDTPGLSHTERAAILGGNAAALLGLEP